MNQVVLMVEMDGREEALSFQGRPIVFDLATEADRRRLGDLRYRRETYSAEQFPKAMSAAEWYMRCARHESAHARNAPELEIPANASELEVCLACGQCIIPERVAEDKAGTGMACTNCGQPLPETRPTSCLADEGGRGNA